MLDSKQNRRDWLTKVGSGIGGLWAAGFGQADLVAATTEGRPQLSFTVISDTHVGYKGGESARRQWERTAAELAKSEARFLLHLGDVVDGGRVEQYAVYLGIREQIGKPVYEIPGNHDPADAFATNIRQEIDHVVDHEWLRCILLSNAHRDSHDGFFEPAQLDWLNQTLQAAKNDDRLTVICCHVPVHANRSPDRGWYVKPDHGQARFYEVLERHREQVLAVFHGHFHNGIRGWSDHSFHEVCFPSALYNQNRGLEAKQAPGYNPDEFRPGYTLVTIGDGRLQLRYKPTGEDPTVEKTISTTL